MSSGYAKGRRAMSSAEKPENYQLGRGQQFRREIERSRRTLPGRIRQMEEDKGKGIPMKPSKKGIKIIERGDPYAIT